MSPVMTRGMLASSPRQDIEPWLRMNSIGDRHRRTVFLAYQDVFVGSHAEMRKLKKIRALVRKKYESRKHLTGTMSPEYISEVVKFLLEEGWLGKKSEARIALAQLAPLSINAPSSESQSKGLSVHQNADDSLTEADDDVIILSDSDDAGLSGSDYESEIEELEREQQDGEASCTYKVPQEEILILNCNGIDPDPGKEDSMSVAATNGTECDTTGQDGTSKESPLLNLAIRAVRHETPTNATTSGSTNPRIDRRSGRIQKPTRNIRGLSKGQIPKQSTAPGTMEPKGRAKRLEDKSQNVAGKKAKIDKRRGESKKDMESLKGRGGLGPYHVAGSNPTYLPFKLQHAIVSTTQRMLEESCYYFSEKWLPHVLEKTEWDSPEAGELTRWKTVFAKHDIPAEAIVLVEPLERLFSRLNQIRHCAVHRQPQIPIKSIEAMLADALSLTVTLRDDVRAAQFQRWLSEIMSLTAKQDMKINSRKEVYEEELRVIREELAVLYQRQAELGKKETLTMQAQIQAGLQYEYIEPETLSRLENTFGLPPHVKKISTANANPSLSVDPSPNTLALQIDLGTPNLLPMDTEKSERFDAEGGDLRAQDYAITSADRTAATVTCLINRPTDHDLDMINSAQEPTL